MAGTLARAASCVGEGEEYRGGGQVDVDLIGLKALVGKQCFDRPWK